MCTAFQKFSLLFLENASLPMPNRNLRYFTLFGFDTICHNSHSVRCASVSDDIGRNSSTCMFYGRFILFNNLIFSYVVRNCAVFVNLCDLN